MSSISLNGSVTGAVGRPALARFSGDSAETRFPGIPDSVALVRHWARGHLADDILTEDVREDVVLAVSELATNAICHSASGLPGRGFTARLLVSKACVRIEVEDRGGRDTPRIRVGSCGSERGRGLVLVAAVMDAWGPLEGGARGVWAEVWR